MFRVSLDGNILTSEPIGLNDLQVRIERDDQIRGLFFRYISDLTFTGDGFTYIKGEIDSNGLCGEIDVLIEVSCNGNWSDFFEGIIYLSEITEVNLAKGEISTDIEDNSLSARIIRSKDVDIVLNSGNTINGSALADIGVDIDCHDYFTGNYDFTGIEAYSVFDLLQYCLDYITDSAITLESDFLTTPTNRENKWTIQFDAPLVTGNTIVIDYTNGYGEAIQLIDTFTVSNAATLKRLADYLPNLVPEMNGGQQKWERVDSNGTDTLTLYSWLSFTIDSVQVTGGASQANATITEVDTLTRGGANYMMTSGYRLAATEDKELTLKLTDLIEELAKWFNLSFRLWDDSGTIKMKIEPEEDMFDSGTLMTLSAVNDLSYEPVKSYNHSAISVGGGFDTAYTYDPLMAAKQLSFSMWTKNSWGSTSCFSMKLKAVSAYISDGFGVYETVAAVSSDKADDSLFLIEVDDPSAGTPQSQQWHHRGFDGIGYQDRYVYNAFITGSDKIIYNGFRLVNGTFAHPLRGSSGAGLTISKTLDLTKKYGFKFNLTLSEMQSILSSPLDKIVFSSTEAGVTSESGWIDVIEFNVETGETTFELLAE